MTIDPPTLDRSEEIDDVILTPFVHVVTSSEFATANNNTNVTSRLSMYIDDFSFDDDGTMCTMSGKISEDSLWLVYEWYGSMDVYLDTVVPSINTVTSYVCGSPQIQNDSDAFVLIPVPVMRMEHSFSVYIGYLNEHYQGRSVLLYDRNLEKTYQTPYFVGVSLTNTEKETLMITTIKRGSNMMGYLMDQVQQRLPIV